MSARSQRMSGGLLIAGAVIGLVGNALHPHTADPEGAAVVRAIAASDTWVPIHLTIILAILFIIGGLVGLARRLDDGPGESLARVGLVAAAVGGAVTLISLALDGFAMKALARSWAAAPDGEAATAMRLAVALRDTGSGVWSIGMLVLFGTAFACFGLAVSVSGRFSGWLGWIAILGAGGATVAALLRIAATGDVQAAESIFLASSLLLTMWTLSMGILMWRRSADGGA
ncbi:MAG: DUF4386 family protein [Gemmatimonadetes bacterium]|nr:DUF4386 family protein [Gemmatimonadota bacterium]